MNPSALCILGGPHANAMKEQCLQECSELDVVIPGAGEIPFAQLVDRLDHYQDVAGIIYRRAEPVSTWSSTQQREQAIATIEMPEPAYHLLSRPLSAYAHNIRTFPGCPYECDFCIERLSWRGRKGHNSLRRVVAEIQRVSQGSAAKTLIHFSDSIFTLDKQRTLELCHLLTKAQLNVVFSCDTRVDHVDTEIVKALANAGFVSIRLGIEHLDDTILRRTNKGIIVDQSLQTLRLIRSAAPHMMIHAYMLTGLPGSTIETFSQAAQSIRSLIMDKQVDVIGNKMLVPYPGTPYFLAPQQHQMEILHHDWSKFDRLSLPVYRMLTLTEYQIYFGFVFLESTLQQAYECRIANSPHIDQALPENLDYVYRSYVQQIGPRLEAGTLIVK